mmetsp:Transcript_21587/g.47197  ORF Transcript_21587/g.47197 Transcript_21587/m.47197 type:complete len:209 (-) Transcript_21587:47-673(-)
MRSSQRQPHAPILAAVQRQHARQLHRLLIQHLLDQPYFYPFGKLLTQFFCKLRQQTFDKLRQQHFHQLLRHQPLPHPFCNILHRPATRDNDPRTRKARAADGSCARAHDQLCRAAPARTACHLIQNTTHRLRVCTRCSGEVPREHLDRARIHASPSRRRPAAALPLQRPDLGRSPRFTTDGTRRGRPGESAAAAAELVVHARAAPHRC